MDKKVQRCLALMGEGLSGDSLINKLAEEFEISPFAADWIVKDALSGRKANGNGEPAFTQSEHIAERRAIYTGALARGDTELALKALQDLGKLTGVYEEATDKEISINFKFPDAVGYKPITRDAINRVIALMAEEDSTDARRDTV